MLSSANYSSVSAFILLLSSPWKRSHEFLMSWLLLPFSPLFFSKTSRVKALEIHFWLLKIEEKADKIKWEWNPDVPPGRRARETAEIQSLWSPLKWHQLAWSSHSFFLFVLNQRANIKREKRKLFIRIRIGLRMFTKKARWGRENGGRADTEEERRPVWVTTLLRLCTEKEMSKAEGEQHRRRRSTKRDD